MAATEKTISSLIKTQLPDFVRADHPKFKRFLELYYQWLETNAPDGISNTAGNTIYHAMNIGDYRDVDQTPDDFLTFFKQELLPYFPEKTALDIRKILKSAREFYSKKGSVESVKWLFKVLFNEDIEINYPKEQILIASDGKWKKPKAFRITVGETNKNIDVNLLEKRLVVGVDSGATCIVESADRTIDSDSGKEIIEIYISNIKRYFNNGEYIKINYIDANGVEKVFSEKIVGTISNIYLDSNIKTDPQQKRRGLLYNVGDPVVITGGLAPTAEARPGIAIVGNVSSGSIEAVNTIFPGYGYRTYANTEVLVLRSTGDDPNANQETDLRVFALNLTSNTTNSQGNFIEPITYEKTPIDYLADVVIEDADYPEFTSNNQNIVLNVTEDDRFDYFENNEEIWANGDNYPTALFKAKIATPNGNTKLTGTVSFLGDSSLTGTVSIFGNTALTGTITANVRTANIIGSGTSFLSEISSGEYIRILDDMVQVSSVANNTFLVLARHPAFTQNGLTAYKANTTVIGVGTSFSSALTTSDSIVVNGQTIEIDTIVNNTKLTVATPFSSSGSGYTAYKNAFSTTLAVVGNGTNFSILTAGQNLEVNGNRRVIANIANSQYLNVTSAYASTFTGQEAFRIGSFAAEGGAGSEYTGDIVLYDVYCDGELSTVLAGAQLNTHNTLKSFTFNSITETELQANANSQLFQCFKFQTVNTGGIALITVNNGGAGFRSPPTLRVTSEYDTILSENYPVVGSEERSNTIQTFKDLGFIAHVYINNGGKGYTNGDTITFSGRGYGGNANVTVNATGSIVSVNIIDRGEGHLVRPEAIVHRASPTYSTTDGTATVNAESKIVIGSGTSFANDFSTKNVIKINGEDRRVVSVTNATYLTVNTAFTSNATSQTVYKLNGEEATLTAYLFGDGFEYAVDTSAIGRIKDIRLIYRGYDYLARPNVSLKVIDTIINPISEAENFTEQEFVYQGTSLATSTFRANVKSYSRTTNLLRLYDFSGTLDKTVNLITANGVVCTVNPSANVAAPSQYPNTVIATGLPNPMVYGDGKAKALATFANGLIEFNGFYINSDGFVSADKVLQDGKIYHNFSYVIQSNKDLADYQTTIKNIAHPSGLIGISKRIISTEENLGVTDLPEFDYIQSSTNDSSNVQIANSYSNVVTGNSSTFLSTANVGDLFIIIDSGNPLRGISKIISKVNSDTELEVEGDFIYVGQGKARTNNGNTWITIANNTNSISNFLQSGDQIRMNLISVLENGKFDVYDGSKNIVQHHTTHFVGNVFVGSEISINNEIRRVTSVIDDLDLTVNAAFSSALTNKIATIVGDRTLKGTVSVTAACTDIIGVSTNFVGNVTVGIAVSVNNEVRNVTTVTSDTQLVVDAPFTYSGSGNTIIRKETSKTLDGAVKTNGGTTVTNNPSTLIGNVVVGSQVTINNETRVVTAVIDDFTFDVDSDFTYAITDKYVTANSVIVKTVNSISGNKVQMNSAYFATKTNLVYQIAPNYNSQDYDYKILTLTAD